MVDMRRKLLEEQDGAQQSSLCSARNYPEPLTSNCVLHKGIEPFQFFRRRHVWLYFVLAPWFFIL